MTVAKLRAVARLWAFALAFSALLAAAGQRWPQPLPIRGDLVAALLVLPPLAMAVLLLARWSLPGEGGESDPNSEDTQA
jgi:hypothetical protein